MNGNAKIESTSATKSIRIDSPSKHKDKDKSKNVILFQCRKIQLGITHEMGSLEFYKNKIVWRSKLNSSLKHSVKGKDVKNIEWLNVDRRKKLMKISFIDKNRPHFRMFGFIGEDEFEIDKHCFESLGQHLSPKVVCVKGWNWGRFVLRSQEMVYRSEDKQILFTVPYNCIHQSVMQAKNELSFEFNNVNSKTPGGSTSADQLMEMRVYIPDDDDNNNANPWDNINNNNQREAAYEEFHSLLQKKAKLEQDKSLIIAWFENINFRMPRGKKQIQFYPKHFIFRSSKNSYKIEYSAIKRLFVFEQPGGDKIAFLVNLKHAVRQGGSEYDCLIMEFPTNEQCTAKINASDEELKTKYLSRDGKTQVLSKSMNGPTYDILSRVFMALSKIKIITAKSFHSYNNDHCIRAVHSATNGLLYPLEKSIFFIWIPAFIKHNDIDYIEFRRVNESNVKMFDLAIFLLKRKNKSKPLLFTSIDKDEYEPLVRYFLSKQNVNIADRNVHEARIKQADSQSMQEGSRRTRTRKHLQQSSKELVKGMGFELDDMDDDDDDDDDYDVEMDASMLKKDKKYDEKYRQMIEEKNMTMEKLDRDKIIGSDGEEQEEDGDDDDYDDDDDDDEEGYDDDINDSGDKEKEKEEEKKKNKDKDKDKNERNGHDSEDDILAPIED